MNDKPDYHLRKVNYLILAGALLFCPGFAQAQEPDIAVSDTLVEVKLADGSTLFGKIVGVTPTEVSVRTTAGAQVVVAREQIRSVRVLQGRIRANGEVWPEDTNDLRLFLTPTGRALQAGRAQFGVLELFFPFLSYGVTDRITMTAGMPIIPDAIGQVFYFAPKIEVVRTPAVRISASVLALLGGADGEFGSAGLLYGVGTIGNADRAVTLGFGFPFISGEGENEIANRPVLTIGGESRVSRRVKLLTESMFFSYRETDYYYAGSDVYSESRNVWAGLIGAGARFIGERIAADAGVGLAVGDGVSCCVPLVNFSYTFGKR